MKKFTIKASTSSDTKSKKRVKKYVKAAEGDDFDEIDDMFGEDSDEEADGIMDAIDDVADDVEDIQDQIDDVDEDEVDIAVNNNIADHFIAECDKCHGIFISAVVESDQEIDHVAGVCPLCGRDSEQYLKWVIKDAT